MQLHVAGVDHSKCMKLLQLCGFQHLPDDVEHCSLATASCCTHVYVWGLHSQTNIPCCFHAHSSLLRHGDSKQMVVRQLPQLPQPSLLSQVD